MKALSVKQPWADLIACGVKDIENRTWRTNFRGRVYIHASQKIAGYDVDLLTSDQSLDKLDTYWHPLLYTTSAIVGEVDIIDCVQNHPSIWAEKDVWNWVLAKSVLYDTPILNVKGGLSFWEYTPSI